ncbi:MAG: TolC family protein [Bacteroidota bacterium]
MFLLAFLPSMLFGQGNLTLLEAVSRGLDNNYQIRIAERDKAIAKQNNQWGNVGRYPSLRFNVPASFFRTQNPGSFLAGRENLNGTLVLDWQLFDGFAMQANKERFALLERQSAGNAAVIIENNVQAIILGYQEVLLAEAQREVLKEVLDNSRERLDYEEYRKRLGTGGTFEILQFRNAVLSDSINLVSQYLTLRNARRTLNLLMGEAPDTDFSLTDSLQTFFPVYDLVEMDRRMMEENNSLQNQYLTQRIRSQESRIAKAGLYPTLSFTGNTNYSTGNVILRNRDPDTVEEMPTITSPVNAFDYSLGLTLSFNIYNGGAVRRQMDIARLNEEIASLQKDDLLLALRSELQTHFDNYRARRQILGLQNENLNVAKLNLELSAERFQSGLINSLDYRTIQLQYLNVQFARLGALRDLKSAETELLRITGGLVKGN